MGSKTHSVSLTLDISPAHDLSSHGKPSVNLDLSGQRHKALPGGYSKEKLVEAIKEGVEGGCLQGTGLVYSGVQAFGPVDSSSLESRIVGLLIWEIEILPSVKMTRNGPSISLSPSPTWPSWPTKSSSSTVDAGC